MTPEELAAIRARAEAATPGPWHDVPGRFIPPDDWNHRYTAHQVIEGCVYNPNAENDYAFIAHAREDIPRLLDEVAALRAWGERVLADAQAAWRRYHAVRAAADGLREELERLVLSHHATLEEGLQCDRCEDAVNEIVDYDALEELAADDRDAQIRLVVDAARRFVQALDATEASIRPDPEGVIDGPHGQALRAAVAALDAA